MGYPLAPSRSEVLVFIVPLATSALVAASAGLFSDIAAFTLYSFGLPVLIGPVVGVAALLMVYVGSQTSGGRLASAYLVGACAGVVLFAPIALGAGPVAAPIRQPLREAYAESLIMQMRQERAVGRKVVGMRGLQHLLSDDGRVVAYVDDEASVWFFDMGSDSARVYSEAVDTQPTGSLSPEDRREQLSAHWWLVRR